MTAIFALAVAAALAQSNTEDPAPAKPTPCLEQGMWQDGNGDAISQADALSRASRARIILLGEAHETPGIHAWQAETARLLARDGRPLVIAVEWLPRAAQPALDRFAANKISEEAFQAESDWKQKWGYDFAAYRPVFALARERGMPINALNIDRSIVRTTARQGLNAGLAAALKAGTPLGEPAPPSQGYRARLEASFAEHSPPATRSGTTPPKAEAMERFIAAQTIWDRAMAEAIAAILAARPEARVVAMMGHGHVEGGEGAAHQLAALGHHAVFSAIPGLADPERQGACTPGAHPAHYLAGWKPD